MNERSEIGRLGEKHALGYLMRNGFTIRHINWRSGRYELDIVAQARGTIHFVEVKCRKADGLTTPEDAITPAKFAALTKAAQAYIAMNGLDSYDYQFDLIAVDHSDGEFEVRYIPEAMQPSW